MLFRSEEHVDRWCTVRGRSRGAVISLETTWALARAWYADRLDPGWQRRTAAETQALFTGLGLAGPFWNLARPLPSDQNG